MLGDFHRNTVYQAAWEDLLKNFHIPSANKPSATTLGITLNVITQFCIKLGINLIIHDDVNKPIPITHTKSLVIII